MAGVVFPSHFLNPNIKEELKQLRISINRITEANRAFLAKHKDCIDFKNITTEESAFLSLLSNEYFESTQQVVKYMKDLMTVSDEDIIDTEVE